MKSYTDIKQSKALAKILPLESADMFHFIHEVDTVGFGYKKDAQEFYSKTKFEYLPCWSLSALLNILAKIASEIDDDGSANLSSFMGQWSVNMFDCPIEATDNYDNPVDACVDMIIRLN